jgi:hypothetical protein
VRGSMGMPGNPQAAGGVRANMTRRRAVLILLAGTLTAVAGAAAATPSADPYTASLAYAKCVRAHGVPHPDPDRKGDFSLTPAQEARLRAVPRKTRQAAEDACFHHLEGLNLKPLSPHALALSTAVVADLGRCFRSHGYIVGKPEVKNLPRGKASFGFTPTPRPGWTRADWGRFTRIGHACEKRVGMAERLSKIIAEDRDTGRPPL